MIDKPNNYNEILSVMISYHENEIDVIERDLRLTKFKFNQWQINHIDNQARNLTGNI